MQRFAAKMPGMGSTQDSTGVYSIDELLGQAGFYRLWLEASRCSSTKCHHAESLAPAASRPAGQAVSWNDRLLGSILPPPDWRGTSAEWRQLAAAVTRNCTCPSAHVRFRGCPAHGLLGDRGLANRLLFGRRMSRRLQAEEFTEPRAAQQPQAQRL
jgi:hypothetical protein